MPESESNDRPGQELLERYMAAQAEVIAESMFLCFALGQAAAAVAVEHPEVPEVIRVLETDANDLAAAGERLNEIVAEMVVGLRASAGMDEPQPAEESEPARREDDETRRTDLA